MSRLSAQRHRSLSLIAGAGALALSGLFAANLAAHTPGSGGPQADAHASGLGRTARRLGLSDDQQDQIRGILKSTPPRSRPARGVADRPDALREAMGAQPLDESRIRQQALALGEVRADGAVLRARIRSEIWPVLTSEQQEKAKQLRSMKGKREKRRIDALERWLQNG